MYKDWLGQEIKVGSRVIYAISESHFAKLVAGEVIEITPLPPTATHQYYGRTFTLKIRPYFENTDVIGNNEVLGDKFRVGAGDRRIGFRKNPITGFYQYERVEAKPVTVKNVEKVTVCDELPALNAMIENYEAGLDDAIFEQNIEIEKETEKMRRGL